MKEYEGWNPGYIHPAYQEPYAFPWLYPYGNQLRGFGLWRAAARPEDEMDARRLRELYPLMARRLQPYVEEECSRLEYPGSMMYDEYPDRLSLLKLCGNIWENANAAEELGENAEKEKYQDLIGVLLLQEILKRRKKKRNASGRSLY